MQEHDQNREHKSTMLAVVLDYLCVQTADISPERLGMELRITPSWIRALREKRSTKPDINRVEYIFLNYCGGKVEVKKAD